jgi:hypothetical protein
MSDPSDNQSTASHPGGWAFVQVETAHPKRRPPAPGTVTPWRCMKCDVAFTAVDGACWVCGEQADRLMYPKRVPGDAATTTHGPGP